MKKVLLHNIPNIFSFGNMLMGFLSITYALYDEFALSAIFILIAMLLDFFDGRIARKLNIENPLGIHFDTFADLLSFGVAPAFIFFAVMFSKHSIYQDTQGYDFIYNFISNHYFIGMAFGFIFTASAAYRLAKFNNQENKNQFTGIPTTMAGGFLTIILLFGEIPTLIDPILNKLHPSLPESIILPWWTIIIIFLFLSYLMNSKFKFNKPKSSFLNFTKKAGLIKILINIGFILLTIFLFKYFLIIPAVIYIFGPVLRNERIK